MAKDEKIVVKPGLGPTISMLIIAALVASNLWFGWKFAQVSVTLAEKEQAVQVIKNNYYGFFNWVKQEFQAVSGKSRAEGFFDKLFGREGRDFPDLNEWEDPMKVRPIAPIEE